jgi:hypothetical protein
MAPFFAKLPSLRSEQKAAAVNLGIFPDSGQPAYAYVPSPGARSPAYSAPQQPTPPPPVRQPPSANIAGALPIPGDRLASIDELLRAPGLRPAAERPAPAASRAKPQGEPTPDGGTAKPRVWVQLASGSNPEALTGQFRRIKSRHRDLLDGIGGYVAESPTRARLLIGPFRSLKDANIIVEDLATVRVDAFSWTSPPGQTIRKLSTE